ncbi:HEPN domain-containing protein [Thalassomonas sp. RHCl1]|uniref:HEPN domain-containing protein n=1 Tax=Thalassomonas sp. RHCl1 TaxID=2995320 RepID=UPI00248BD2DD|nr:HEPN domain-containing protein [Thalassomonas sp. RHCl1]
MRKIRKKTDKLVDELIALRNSRKSIDDFFSSHQINFYENCRLMHSFVLNDDNKKDLLTIAYRQYYVFLVSCWETFFRDVFIYVHTEDENLTNRLLGKMKPAADTFDESDIALSELLSKSFNFQNIKDLEEAYDDLWGGSFLQSICSKDAGPCGVNGQVADEFVVKNLFDDWHEIVNKTFSIRHKVVHDANYRPDVDIQFIQKAEAIFLLIPQVATHFIAEKFNLKRIAFSKDGQYFPYIFTVSEILSDDWVVVE